MQDITEIMNMLDWHKPPEVQSKGIALRKTQKQFARLYSR